MWRFSLCILLLGAAFPSVKEVAIRQTVLAILQEARPEFTRDPEEVSELILELEQKSNRDLFEQSLLEELKRFKRELLLYPELAQRSSPRT